MKDDENNTPRAYLLGKTYLDESQTHFHIRNDPIICMATGDRHTLVVTETGRVFCFGDNTSGQLGLGHHNSIEKVSCIKSLKFDRTDEKIVLVACGRESSLAASNIGFIYAFGSNARCQLGFESKEDFAAQCTPIKVDGFPSKTVWKQIAMGAEHACALTTTGEVYVWGSNEDGQCGQPKKYETITKPKKLALNYEVISISCGYYHTGLIRKDKRLFLFGNNDDNQLANSEVTPFSGPIEVSTPKNIIAVACGYQHTAVLTEDGEVYTCGRGDRGQLGLGTKVQISESFQLIPKLPKRITNISAGEGHTAVLDSRGFVYIFGDGKHGKLGFKDFANEFVPRFLDRFQEYKILKIVCGGCQTIFLAMPRPKDRNQSSVSDEDDENVSDEYSINRGSKSLARMKRVDMMNDQSTIPEVSHRRDVKPVGSSNFSREHDKHTLKVERNSDSDENQPNLDLTASMRSELFNTTHATIGGRLQPTRNSFKQQTLRQTTDDYSSLRTGVLDRTVPMVKGRNTTSEEFQSNRQGQQYRSLSPIRKFNKKIESENESESIDNNHKLVNSNFRQESSVKSRTLPATNEQTFKTSNSLPNRSSKINQQQKSRRSSDSSSSSDDDDDESDEKSNPRTARRNSLPSNKKPQASNPSRALPSLSRNANTNDSNELTKKINSKSNAAEKPANDEQPIGFFSRLFGSRSTSATSNSSNPRSRTCLIM